MNIPFILNILITSSVLLIQECSAVIWQKHPIARLHPGCSDGFKALGNFFADRQNYQEMKSDNRAHFFIPCGRAFLMDVQCFCCSLWSLISIFPGVRFDVCSLQARCVGIFLHRHTGQGRGLAGSGIVSHSIKLLFGAHASSTYKSSQGKSSQTRETFWIFATIWCGVSVYSSNGPKVTFSNPHK